MANPFAAAATLQRSRAPDLGGSGRLGSYAGARVSPQTAADWVFAGLRSANQDIHGSHRRLTDRARDLARNDPYARRFLNLISRNVIGPHGIGFQAMLVSDLDGELDEKACDETESAWKRWCEPATCTVDGRHSFTQLLHVVVKAWARDGEALIRMVPGFDNGFGFALQLLDPDQLDIQFNRPAGRGLNEIRMGVEIDRWGRAMAYWLWSMHPSESGGDRRRIRVKASEVIYLGLLERAAQVRAVTWLASVIVPTRMLGGYREAEAIAARLAASSSVIWEPREGYEADEEEDDGPVEWELSPGGSQMAPSGYTAKLVSPEHPNAAYGAFEAAMLGGIAAGLDTSYASLTGDLSKVNYSSIRTGLLDERDVYKTLQGIIIEHVCKRVYREWFLWAITSRAIRVPFLRPSEWRRHKWLPRGWTWIAPEKDIDASLNAVAGGLDSLTRLAGEQGRDFREVLLERQREMKVARELGVPLSAGPASSAPPQNQQTEE